MSVEDTNKIDFIRSEHGTGNAVLVISDHLSWEQVDTDAYRYHVDVLRKKIGNYVHFVECGELNGRFPQFLGKEIVIMIFLKFAPNEAGSNFIESMIEGLRTKNIVLKVEIYQLS